MTTETKTIDLGNGHVFVVSKRWRAKAKANTGKVNILSPEQRLRMVGAPITYRRRKKRSQELLDKIMAMVPEKGVDDTAKQFGVPNWVIWDEMNHVRERLGIVKRQRNGTKYTMEQKIACVKLAFTLVAAGTHNRAPAFAEAGRRLGINGVSVLFQYGSGRITDFPPPHQPKYLELFTPIVNKLMQECGHSLISAVKLATEGKCKNWRGVYKLFDRRLIQQRSMAKSAVGLRINAASPQAK